MTTTRSCSALGQLWAAGVDVDWTQRCRAPTAAAWCRCPATRSQRQRHWVEHNASAAWLAGGAGATGVPAAAHRLRASTRAPPAASRRWRRRCSASGRSASGLSDIDRNANFFELGGDSLIAISVAMTAAHEGLDLTPQDLYENQTVAALAKVLIARYAEGGLARQTLDDAATRRCRRTWRTSSNTACATSAAGGPR